MQPKLQTYKSFNLNAEIILKFAHLNDFMDGVNKVNTRDFNMTSHMRGYLSSAHLLHTFFLKDEVCLPDLLSYKFLIDCFKKIFICYKNKLFLFNILKYFLAVSM